VRRGMTAWRDAEKSRQDAG